MDKPCCVHMDVKYDLMDEGLKRNPQRMELTQKIKVTARELNFFL